VALKPGAPTKVDPKYYLADVLRTGTFTVGTPAKGFITGRHVVTLAYPVRDGNNVIAGVIAVSIDLVNFQPAVARGLAPDVSLRLVNSRGTIVFSNTEPEKWVGQDVSNHPLLSEATARKTATMRGTGVDGIERFYSFSAVENSDWHAGAGIPVASVYEPVYRSIATSTAFALFALLFAVMIAFALARRIARPVEALTRVARSAATNFDTTKNDPPPIAADDAGPVELQTLAREFDAMLRARRNAESGLRESQVRYRELFESNPHPMWVFDTETLAFLAVNDAAVSHYGYSREEFLAMTVRDIRAPEDVPRLQDAIAKVGRGEAVTGFWRHRKKNGDTILVEVSPRALKFGGRSAIMLLVQDVTARIQAQEALAEEQEKFRALTEQSLVGAYVIDSGVIMYMNPRAAEIFGYRADEVAGRPARDFVVEDDWPLLDENVRMRLSGEVESAQYTFRGRRKDGAVVMIGVHGTTAIIGGKRIIIGVLQDITDKLRAEETIRDYIARLERGISGTVDAVSKMVELRDPYTAGHEQRVGDLSAAIAAEMGLDYNMQQGLRIAGGVHDIGKIVVPAEMLSKPTRLSPAEFELIKVHAQHGYEVLKGIDFPWPVAEIARQHHERIDGSGYPRGLKGEEILLEARIMAVADVVESMASHRPYRAALGIEKALDEIESNAGKLYDPQAAAACLRLFREKRYRLPEQT
jgi:PAS domain S-box-containing protein